MTSYTHLRHYASMYSVNLQPTELFQALGDMTRIRIMRLLLSRRGEEACLCEFTDSLNEPEYNISRHLKVLRQVGLLTSVKEGRWVYHRLVKDSSFFKYAYKLIDTLPDNDKIFESDLKRFDSEISKRESGRCRRESSSGARRAVSHP